MLKFNNIMEFFESYIMSKKKLVIISSISFLSILTLLPFYDQDNLITLLHITNHLYSNKPVFLNVGWPGGPFFMIAWVPTYLAYIWSGFNISVAYITLKLILLSLSISTAYILSKFSRSKSQYGIFIFFILNPALIYITLIWAQFDIIPVFFSTLSLYFLGSEKIRNSLYKTSLALVPLFIAILTTYYPLIFIPSLILYSLNRREKLNVLVGSIMVGLVFLISDILFFRGFQFSYLVNLNGNGLTSSFYQGFQYFISLPLPYYIIFLLILVIAVPIVLLKEGYGLYLNIYVLLLLFLYTSASAGFDPYLWLVPFTILVIQEQEIQRYRYVKMAILNIPIFVEVIFSNFIMGTGMQQGIFYFGYNVFHINYLFIKTPAQFQYFVTIFNSLLMSSITGVLIILFTVITKRNKSIPHTLKHKEMRRFNLEKNKSNLDTIKRKKWISIMLIVLMLSAPLSIIFNNTYENISVKDIKNTPTAIFYPSENSNGNGYAMSVINRTYVENGNSIKICPSSPDLYFYRNLSNELMNLNFSLYPFHTIQGFTYTLLTSSIFNLTYTSERTIAIKDNYTLTSQSTIIAGDDHYNYTTISGYNVTTVYFDGSSFITYKLNNTFFGEYHLIEFQPKGYSNIPKYIWFASNENITKGASLILVNQNLILSYGNQSITIPLELSNSVWNYILFRTTESGISIYVNGHDYKIDTSYFYQSDIFNNNSYFTIGYPSQQPISFIGNISLLYSSNHANFSPVLYYYRLTNKSDSYINMYMGNSSSIQIKISESYNHTELLINGDNLNYQQTLKNMTIGKLNSGIWGLNITFYSISLIQLTRNNYFLIPIFYFTFLPYFLIPIIYIYFKKKKLL